MTATYDLIAGLPLRIEDHALVGHERTILQDMTRVTTEFVLRGGGEEGWGEDVTYDADAQRVQLDRGPVHPLAGEWTIDSFSEHLAAVDLFPEGEPAFAASRDFRRWAVESAALDLALRQAGRSLHEVLGGEPRPLRFVVSIRLGDPPAPEGVLERIAAYEGVEFKLDAEPSWDEELIDLLAGTDAVPVFDFKGAYRGTPVDVETDPVLYRRIAEAFPDALLEDPDLTVPEAAAALEPYRDRITWDAPIHSVDDVRALAFAPRTLNSKPSRFGSLRRLLEFYDHCAAEGIALYGGGQSELGCGRGQIQLLAAIFHPDGPNDVAPAGWDHRDWPRSGLPVSPLDPAPEPIGFRRRK